MRLDMYRRSRYCASEAHFRSASEGAICVVRAGLALVLLSIEGILGITHTSLYRTYELSTSQRAQRQDGSPKSNVCLSLRVAHRPAPGPSQAPADTPASTAALTPTMPSGSDVVVSTYSLSTACGPMCGVHHMSESRRRMDIGRVQGSSVHAGWAGCSHLMGGRLVGPLAAVVGDVCGSSGRRR